MWQSFKVLVHSAIGFRGPWEGLSAIGERGEQQNRTDELVIELVILLAALWWGRACCLPLTGSGAGSGAGALC